MRWWRMDCCWNPTDSALEDGPSGAGMDADSNKATELVNNRQFDIHTKAYHLFKRNLVVCVLTEWYKLGILICLSP